MPIRPPSRPLFLLQVGKLDVLYASPPVKTTPYPCQWATIVAQLGTISYSKRNTYLLFEKAAARAKNKGKEVRPVKVFFPVEFTPQTAALKVNSILHKALANYQHLRPIVAWKTAQNLQSFLGLQWPPSMK